ncbi:MAG: helix-turn-helix transcriptional regulator [Lachnospiraceae bacterium]|nr:helix-turn-helix transcriptional regulator [Lachnospiraceae bacterium]
MLEKKDWITAEFNDDEENIIHRHQNKEYLFYQQVATGNIEAIKENINERHLLDKDGVGHLSKDPITNLKYHFVISVALITRVCTENGLEMEKAFRLSDFYIQKLDDINKTDDLISLHARMLLDFTRRMQFIREKASLSRPLSECLNYIYGHLKERITIEDLAEYSQNSTSHISRLFKDELGISASDYIRKAKLESAKNMLRYSDYSLIDIANYYSFASHSHFSMLFQKEYGITPKKYREKYYGLEWSGSDAHYIDNEDSV